jgi:hypothetical protein
MWHHEVIYRAANKLDASNTQAINIASIVYAFLAAAVPLNVIMTFGLSWVCLVADEDILPCTARPEMTK